MQQPTSCSAEVCCQRTAHTSVVLFHFSPLRVLCLIHLLQALNERAAAYHLQLDDVSITHLMFSKEFTTAIESKQVAQQVRPTSDSSPSMSALAAVWASECQIYCQAYISYFCLPHCPAGGRALQICGDEGGAGGQGRHYQGGGACRTSPVLLRSHFRLPYRIYIAVAAFLD